MLKILDIALGAAFVGSLFGFIWFAAVVLA